MAGLTVTEKEHWKQRIDRRIARRIETITTEDQGLLERIKEEARCQALASFGLAELDAEARQIEQQQAAFEERDRLVRRTMLARVRGIPVEAVSTGYAGHVDRSSIDKAIDRRQAVHEERLLAEHELGRLIAALRQERERLIDRCGWRPVAPRSVNCGPRWGTCLGTSRRNWNAMPWPSSGKLPSSLRGREPAWCGPTAARAMN